MLAEQKQELNRAGSLYTEALDLAQEVQSSQDIYDESQALADLYGQMNKPTKARKYQALAAETARQANLPQAEEAAKALAVLDHA